MADTPAPPEPLTAEQKAFFLEHGYLKISNCFTRAQAADVTSGVWTRLGMSPTDKTTWTREWTNMPGHRTFDAAVFAPKAWAAVCELCGGEGRVAPASREWRDSLIVNLGTAAGAGGKPVPPKELQRWHVDGDFFVHYLDSPEQALLVTPLFTDVRPGGGGTVLCPPGVGRVARWLAAHPAGVSPRMAPRGHADFAREGSLQWYCDLVRGCDDDASFVEVCGDVGDVFLCHPFMTHCAASNPRRDLRIITNPPVSLRAPHCFDRPDGAYSLVERKTIDAVGGEDKLRGWKITMPREPVVPARLRIQAEWKAQELKRLEEERQKAAEFAAA
ncbi:hypothetical protein F4780DRAFT_554486 [Xylariomycetidae sp. FL0641]|nr:hypothetical protein F4780DRAFT_554486 [Xylariomycetidae sp. FL0641]